MAPFDASGRVGELAEFVAGVSRELGLGEMGTVFLGGGSDAGAR